MRNATFGGPGASFAVILKLTTHPIVKSLGLAPGSTYKVV